ncbi:hypothetical protein E5K00_07740 [Hymenobacter aquaticus]|uniref:DUF922 domain-containing protein n=1 Tax=Hymenobacter aquaticus TaxID=1867101 RepID=A0A4Z0Q4U3_9BACT|nr:hypothetical protein [Hymenobacter aquaticus]TGE25080.1 hypothetical protein E5K00_07740 [Hymenobacter aquaticus]
MLFLPSLRAGLVCWVLAAFFLPGRAAAQLPAAGLKLLPPTTVLATTEFYVAQVLDQRPTPTAVAWLLLPPAKAGQAATPRAVDLQGGSLAAIRTFIGQSLPRPGRRPLTARLLECRVTETAVPGQPAQVEGRVEIKLAFEWQREGQTVPLTDYHGAARYRRPLAQPAVVEPALRQALTEAVRYLHQWVHTQAPTSLKLATGLRLRFTDVTSQTQPDTLFYDPARPLRFPDFTAPSRSGPYAAAVFPSFAYAGQPRVVQGVLQLDLQLKVFVVRSSSWASLRDAYTLNHEQRHFDLVKLVAERFKRRLTPERMNLQDYNSILQYEYLVAFQEMNRLQEQYDAETRGGQDTAAQQRWNQRIDQELRTYGVGPPEKPARLPGPANE